MSRDEGKWAFINVQPGGEVCHRRLGVETMKLAQYTRTQKPITRLISFSLITFQSKKKP